MSQVIDVEYQIIKDDETSEPTSTGNGDDERNDERNETIGLGETERQNKVEQEYSEEHKKTLHSFVVQHWSVFASEHLDIEHEGDEPIKWAFNDERLLCMTADAVLDKFPEMLDEENGEEKFAIYTVTLYEMIFRSMKADPECGNDVIYELSKFNDKFNDRHNRLKMILEERNNQSLKKYVKDSYGKAEKIDKDAFNTRFSHLFGDNWWERLPDNSALKNLYEATNGDLDEKTTVISIDTDISKLIYRLDGNPKYTFENIYHALAIAEIEALENPSENQVSLELIEEISQYFTRREELFALGSNPNELKNHIETLDGAIIQALVQLGIINDDTGEINPNFAYQPDEPSAVEEDQADIPEEVEESDESKESKSLDEDEDEDAIENKEGEIDISKFTDEERQLLRDAGELYKYLKDNSDYDENVLVLTKAASSLIRNINEETDGDREDLFAKLQLAISEIDKKYVEAENNSEKKEDENTTKKRTRKPRHNDADIKVVSEEELISLRRRIAYVINKLNSYDDSEDPDLYDTLYNIAFETSRRIDELEENPQITYGEYKLLRGTNDSIKVLRRVVYNQLPEHKKLSEEEIELLLEFRHRLHNTSIFNQGLINEPEYILDITIPMILDQITEKDLSVEEVELVNQSKSRLAIIGIELIYKDKNTWESSEYNRKLAEFYDAYNQLRELAGQNNETLVANGFMEQEDQTIEAVFDRFLKNTKLTEPQRNNNNTDRIKMDDLFTEEEEMLIRNAERVHMKLIENLPRYNYENSVLAGYAVNLINDILHNEGKNRDHLSNLLNDAITLSTKNYTPGK